MELAQDKGLDLVEVAKNTNPPVCRIMDFGKFKYNESKTHQIKTTSQKIKMIWLHLNTDEHDLNTKAKKVINWIKKRNKVKIDIALRGREKAHQDIAREKITNFVKSIREQDVEDKIKISQNIKKTPQGLQIIIYA